MFFDLRLDPTEVAVNRTELALNSGQLQVDEAGIDWGDGQIQAYLADSRVGSMPVGRRWPDRIIKIPLIAVSPTNTGAFHAAKEDLMQKVAQIQREGVGWLKRQSGLYADVIDATLTFPDRYGERFGWENGVILQLECSPDFYGDEVALDSITATNGVVASVLKQSSSTAVIDGAQDARARVIVTDTSGHDQNGVWWGVRSQYYDSATTAKTFYEAEALTKINGSSAHTHSGASGGTTVMNSQLIADNWMSIMVTDLSAGSQLTHRGSYRVIARAYSATAAPKLRLLWGIGKASTFITNNETVFLPDNANFYEMDLGVIRIDAPAIGSASWRGVIQAYASTAGDPIEIDRLTLVPVAEGSGSLQASPTIPPSVISVSGFPTSGSNSGSGATWTITSPTNCSVGLSANTSKLLQLTGFGFAIPSTATIVGISLVFQGTAGFATFDSTVELLKAGTAVGNNEALPGTWPSVSSRSYGGGTDLWGTTWTPAQVNASNFGFELAVSSLGTSTVTMGSPSITIAYTLGSAFSATPNRVCYASESLEVRTDGAYHTTDGTVWSEIVPEDGDLPRIPASGLEVRPCELLVVTSEGNLISQTGDSYTQPSTALDSFTAQVKYRPSWLFAP